MWQQTLAMFVDGYRELNSKKMFWVAMGLSVVMMALFAGVHASETEISVFGYSPEVLGIDVNFAIFKPLIIYKYLFSYLVVGFWLTFGATSLGMFSVASIFPDFMGGGAIDLYLSKPISRLRLFITKYLSGLLFVLFQMAAFAVISYFILGIRAGLWQKSVFLAIPIVTCYFSYLYSINVFFGVFTRSSLVSVILTFIVWVVITGVQAMEQGTYQYIRMCQSNVAHYDRMIETNRNYLQKVATPVPGATVPVSPGIISGYEAQIQFNQEQKTRAESQLRTTEKFYRFVLTAAYIFPKTGQTAQMLSNQLLDDDEARLMLEPDGGEHRQRRASRNPDPEFADRINREAEARKDAAMEVRDRPVWWIVGTSLGFEFVLLSLSAWRFCRREY